MGYGGWQMDKEVQGMWFGATSTNREAQESMRSRKKANACIQCGSKKGKTGCRGCCFSCYQRTRRAIIAKVMTWEHAISNGLVEPKKKPGVRCMYA